MNTGFAIAVSAVLMGTWATAADGGEIRGRVVVTQSLTKGRVEVPLSALRESAHASHLESSPAVNEFGRMAVYLQGAGLGAGAPARAVLKQQNRRFDPDFLVLPVGSTVSFPNRDTIFHNVFSLSKVKEFDLGYYPTGQSRTVRFEKPGVVQVYCHLHPNMNAVVLVVPSAWYAQPAANGSFQFSDVPAGVYQVVLWHKSAGYFQKQVRVPENGSAEIELSIPKGQEEAP